MNIEKRLLSKNEFSRPGLYLKPVKGIVIHWIGNPGTSAIANRNYFESLKNQPPGKKPSEYTFASAHFIIGLRGEIIQCLLEDEVAYHVGAIRYTDLALEKLSDYPNNCTLGIELCHPSWEGNFFDDTLESARELILELSKRYKLKRDNIYRHYDITEKECPRYFVRNKNEWENFLVNVFKS